MVVKPLDASHGRGVSLNLQNEARCAWRSRRRRSIAATSSSRSSSPAVTTGPVVNGHVVAVAERVPGHVVGDGEHTVQELIDIVNSDPLWGGP